MTFVVEENGKMIEFEFESTPETDAMLKQICVKECFVRCKDCKYWEKSFGYNCKEYWDCKLGLKDTEADDFCSRGVKK